MTLSDSAYSIDALQGQHTTATLAEVLIRVGQGDRAAFSELYSATSRKLFGVVLRILNNQELAEEVLQEVYLKVWNKASDFDKEKASPITWMAVIARNRALDELRKRQVASVADSEDVLLNIEDESATPDEQTELNKEMQRLSRCLDGLEENKADMIKLAYLDGYSRQQLAEKFDQPLGTIKTWLHRSLKQLKDCLET